MFWLNALDVEQVAGVPQEPRTDKDKRMVVCLAGCSANGWKVKKEGRPLHQKHKVPTSSFYDARKWCQANPGKIWCAYNGSGGLKLLTEEDETELVRWVCTSQMCSGGVSLMAVRRTGFKLLQYNSEHFAKVKAQYKEYRDPAKQFFFERLVLKVPGPPPRDF